MATPVKQDIKTMEKISKALADRNRLIILQYITKKGGCAQCSELNDIVELSQPSISHHIKILAEAGLIEPEKEGRHFKYTLNQPVLNDYIKFLKNLKNP